ncbi:MAG: DUF1552 domain-containing protein [Deltaproteobacteria bacterium]|nr:DUF1552 domain-containing protein [Deltaproteobacteria bacterium]
MTRASSSSSSLPLSRRTVLQFMGLQLALPLMSSLLPTSTRAQAAPRQRFIGVFFPNGAHMPGAVDGNWNFAEALSPLDQAGLTNNTMIVRGLHNGFGDVDPHWQNTAGFLSCRRVTLGDAAVARAGKSLDQIVADARPTPLRSLEVGAPYYHVHPLNDHPGYSHDYLNRISWQSDDAFRSPIADPRQLFAKLFATGDGGAAQLRYLHARRRSVLDHLHRDATRLQARLPAEARPVLSTYMDSVRDVERRLDGVGAGTCTSPEGAPAGDFGDRDANYTLRYQLMHRMIALAMQCGSVGVATLMYGPSSSDLSIPETLGAGNGHHTCAHNRGDTGLIDRLRRMNLLQAGLLAHLLGELRNVGVLDSTLVLYGSDMSDGDLHLTTNLPVLLCGGGSDLRFGQAVGSADAPRPFADLQLEILQLLGAPQPSWGDGQAASTGAPTGILV